MPAKAPGARRASPAMTTQAASRSAGKSRLAARGPRSSQGILVQKDDEESDGPLALTPLRPRRATQRKRQDGSKSSNGKTFSRQKHAVDRVVGGVQMGEGDLVPPSDEEEFDVWAAERDVEMRSDIGAGSTTSRARSESERLVMPPSSPTEMVRMKLHAIQSSLGRRAPLANSTTPAVLKRKPDGFVRLFSGSESSGTEEDDDLDLGPSSQADRGIETGNVRAASDDEAADEMERSTDRRTEQDTGITVRGASERVNIDVDLGSEGNTSGIPSGPAVAIASLASSASSSLSPPPSPSVLRLDAKAPAASPSAEGAALDTSSKRHQHLVFDIIEPGEYPDPALDAAAVDPPLACEAGLVRSSTPASLVSKDEGQGPLGDMIEGAREMSSMPVAAFESGIPQRPPRIPLYSAVTPKRRCMDANDRSPLQAVSQSQPISPFQPAPSFEYSQYNQLGVVPQQPEVDISDSERERLQNSQPGDISERDHLDPEPPPSSSNRRKGVHEMNRPHDTPADWQVAGTARRSESGSPSPREERVAHDLVAPPQIPVDAALQHFRSARTFRTRTALQLQPYTRERQVYEAVLRKGGLKSGRYAVARPKDISSEGEEVAEDELPDSPESTPRSQAEQIVIGSTLEQSEPKERRTFRHINVVDEDRTEYFLLYGVETDEDDELADARLQKIARKRYRMEREDRKRKRLEKKIQREFESFLRKDKDAPSPAQDASPASDDQARHSRPMPMTGVYRKRRDRPDDANASRSEQLTLPLLPMSPLHFAVSDFQPQTPTTSNPSARLETPASSHRPPLEEISPTVGHLQTNNRSPSVKFVSQVLGRSGSSSSPSEESESEQAIDKRARIARRMLPAAMLKRLAHEAESRRQGKSGPANRQPAVSPTAGPGRAVRRQGAGDADVFDLFDAEASSQSGSEESTNDLLPGRQIYEVFDSGSEDEGSQAEEDNRGGETLARLYEGDFESIVRGRIRPAAHSSRIQGKARAKRPTVSLRRRDGSRRNRARDLVQTRLSFPPESKGAQRNRHTPSSARSSSMRKSGPKRRPAIRLDERTIFSARDFELDHPDNSPAPLPAASRKRLHQQAPAAASRPAVLQARVDIEIGKAKSWANFEKFSVDFDISPLPSGLHCSGFPIARVAPLLDRMESAGPASLTYEDPIEDLGITFIPDADDATLATAIGLYFDKLDSHLFAQQYQPSDGVGDVVSFLSAFLSADATSAVPSWEDQLVSRLDAIEIKVLGIIDNTGDIVDRHRQVLILALLWYLLELKLVLAVRRPIPARKAAAESSMIFVFRSLLAAGFDKAIRPLKICLRGESINGEMTDLLPSLWISVIRSTSTYFEVVADPEGFDRVLLLAITEAYHLDPVGPIAAERIWYITFGLGAMSQFNESGRTTGVYKAIPRWGLVRKALSVIKIAHEEETEERSHRDLLRGRDRYVRVMVARCIRLSAVWKWNFSRESFAIVTRDLGQIFKQRQYRNFPTEPPVDYPEWILSYDIGKTAQSEAKHETAFEMYLRLVCVAACDIIEAAQSLEQAQQAEKDVQRLIMSITPISPVKFNRLFPPTARQLAQLINRYATMVAACYFSPSVLPWLLANARKWTAFESADFESRQVTIRGLMYVGVACRHHGHSLQPIISRLAEILQLLQSENAAASQAALPAIRATPAVESHRTMVLVISCFKQIILQSSYEGAQESNPKYPDPALLDPSWTSLIFDLSARDHRSGLEVVGAIQAFLDSRLDSLPQSARRAREERVESQDEFGSLGFELDPVTVAQLGGGDRFEDPVEEQDNVLATIIDKAITPRIYRLLSDILTPRIGEPSQASRDDQHREALLSALAQCWTECAAVLVVDHRLLEWSTFIGPFGQQSWLRLADTAGRIQVGLLFMLNILRLDASAFDKYQQDFISLFFSIVGTDRVSVEHRFTSALFRSSGLRNHPLFEGIGDVWQTRASEDASQEEFFNLRSSLLEVIFANINQAFGLASSSATLRKPFLYRCVNDLVSSLERNLRGIPDSKVIHKQSYQAFGNTLIRSLKQHLGDYINPHLVPGLKSFPA